MSRILSAVPTGLLILSTPFPAPQAPGYFQSPLSGASDCPPKRSRVAAGTRPGACGFDSSARPRPEAPPRLPRDDDESGPPAGTVEMCKRVRGVSPRRIAIRLHYACVREVGPECTSRRRALKT